MFVALEAGQEPLLDASSRYNPDGDMIYFHWFHDKQVSAIADTTLVMVPTLEITDLAANAPWRTMPVKIPPLDVCCLGQRSGRPVGVPYHPRGEGQ